MQSWRIGMDGSYRWKCSDCPTRRTFAEVTGTRSIHGFLWDILLRSDWDQKLLAKNCPECGKLAMRITYKFPRKAESIATVHHIVGIDKGSWMPMMWETTLDDEIESPLFDFKYIVKGRLFGLNRPAVFSQDDLREVFTLYCTRAGKQQFP
jgi:hypothetical protein